MTDVANRPTMRYLP